MSLTEHERAVTLAQQATVQMGTLFDRVGNSDAPSGVVLGAYRTARAALSGNLSDARLVADVMQTLRASVLGELGEIFADAQAGGAQQAEDELAIYDLPPSDEPPPDEPDPLDVIGALLDAQAQQIELYALLYGDDAEAMILGDAEHGGLLLPSIITGQAALLLVTVWAAAQAKVITGALGVAGAQNVYQRQAIAAIDERTTDCCLHVHGRVVGMNQPFTLTGTPRFADRIMAPPFHRYCRTSIALVHADDQDDALTHEMVRAAGAEIRARALALTNARQEIHPASATSRRT